MAKITIVKRNPSLISRMIEDEFTILDPKSGTLYQLNRTASAIWKYLWKPRNCDEIIKRLDKTFAKLSENVKKDVDEFIFSSLKNGLIVPGEK